MEIEELIAKIILIIVAAILIKLAAWLLPVIVVLAVLYELYIFLTER
ncbi:hypothetical protein [uncultured Methanobrevibacter sp.]